MDTDKYENMRLLFLDFIDIGEDEAQWKCNLEIYDGLLAEVMRLDKQYAELREALVGDSRNWKHEELIEKALELVE